MSHKKDTERLVIVDWLDPAGGSQWLAEENAKAAKLCVCKSVGWVINETGDMLVIAASSAIEPDGSRMLGDRTIMPKACVKAIRRLREPKKEEK